MFDEPLLIVDFDGTLWDNDAFLRDLYAAAARYGIESNVMLGTWENSWSHPERRSGYTVRRHAENLAPHTRYDAQEIYAWLTRQHEQMGDYVFPDSLLFLHEMRNAGYGVVLLSHGDPVWQLRKLRSSGLADYFDGVYTTRHHKHGFLKDWFRGGVDDHSKMLFVNDNPEENWTISHQFPRLAQAMRRNLARWKEEQYNRVGHPHFLNLHEIGNYAHAFFSRA